MHTNNEQQHEYQVVKATPIEWQGFPLYIGEGTNGEMFIEISSLCQAVRQSPSGMSTAYAMKSGFVTADEFAWGMFRDGGRGRAGSKTMFIAFKAVLRNVRSKRWRACRKIEPWMALTFDEKGKLRHPLVEQPTAPNKKEPIDDVLDMLRGPLATAIEALGLGGDSNNLKETAEKLKAELKEKVESELELKGKLELAISNLDKQTRLFDTLVNPTPIPSLALMVKKAGAKIDNVNEMYAWLRDNEYIRRDIGPYYNMPMQGALNDGLVVLGSGSRPSTLVTPKGIRVIVNKLLGGK